MWLLALTLASVKDKDRTEKPAEEAEGMEEPAEEPAAERPVGMAGHFQQATLAMLAVAVNDLDGARDLGFRMWKDKMAPSPLRQAAKEVYKAKTVSRAAPAVATLGRACAECHTVGGRGPIPHDVDAVPPGRPIEQHISAATFVWIGLVTPMEDPYLVGLRELLPPVDMDDDDDVLEASDEFQELVDQGLETEAWDDRALYFGRLLTACADCHQTAGVVP